MLPGVGRDWGSMVRYWGIWVDSSSIIGNISNISSITISLVVNMLGTAIRKSNRVRSLSISVTITSLSSVEVGVGVVIGNGIGVSVRGGFIRICRGMVSWGSMDDRGVVSGGGMDNRGMVSGGGMDNGGMVSWRSMDYWGMVDDWGMISWGSMIDGGSMVSWSMNKTSPSSMKTVRRVSNSGNRSSESL